MPYHNTSVLSIVQNIGNFKLIASSDELNVAKYGLKALVYQNQQTKELHFAFAGTDPKCTWDLMDDLGLMFGKTPAKFSAIKELISKVQAQIGEDQFKEYNITCIGHSLGGVLSDLAIAELSSQNIQKLKSVTFDNPGSYNVIKNARQTDQFSNSSAIKICKLQEDSVVYLAEKNFINAMDNHLADNIYLVIPPDIQNSSRTLLNYFYKKYSSLLFSKINLGIADTLFKLFDSGLAISDQIFSHSLKNFQDFSKCFAIDLNYTKTSNGNKIMVEADGWLMNDFSEEEDFVIVENYNCLNLQNKLFTKKSDVFQDFISSCKQTFSNFWNQVKEQMHDFTESCGIFANYTKALEESLKVIDDVKIIGDWEINPILYNL